MSTAIAVAVTILGSGLIGLIVVTLVAVWQHV
jgi:hypothetical protein